MADATQPDVIPQRSSFIIFGSPRSGTTLLSTCLDLHEQIMLPDETDFIVPMAFILDRVHDERLGRKLIQKLIVSTRRFPHSLGEHVSWWDIRKAVRRADYNLGSLFDSIYSTVATKAGKRIAGDKSPNDLGYLGILLEKGLTTSGIKIIHIVRDLRDVVLSLQQTGWVQPPDGEVTTGWWTVNLKLASEFQGNPFYHRLRFEDLLREPKKELEQVCQFLAVPFDERMLDHRHRGEQYRGVAHHANLSQPFRTDRIGVWQREMDPELVKLLEHRTFDELEYFGYPTARMPAAAAAQ